MLGLLMSGRVAIADSEDYGTASSTKQMRKEAEAGGSSSEVRSMANDKKSQIPSASVGLFSLAVKKGDDKAPVSSFMSMIDDYKHKVRGEMNVVSTVAQSSRKMSNTTPRPKKEEDATSALPNKEEAKENVNQTSDNTAHKSDSESATSLEVNNEKLAPVIQQANDEKTAHLQHVGSVGAIDSYLKEPPMYYVGMARIVAASLFKKPENTVMTKHKHSGSTSHKAPHREGGAKELLGCQDTKKAEVKNTAAAPAKVDQVADAMEFIDMARSSAVSLFSRSKDVGDISHGEKSKDKKVTISPHRKRDEATESMDLVDKAKSAAISLFSSSKEADAPREVVECLDEDEEDAEDNDIVIVQTNRQPASLSSVSPYLSSSSRPPRSRTASLDQVYPLASCLRKSSADSSYVSVSDMYSLASEEEFVDHGFGMGEPEPIEEEESDAGSPSIPPKVRRDSVDTGSLSSSKFNMSKETQGDKGESKLFDGSFTKVALSILSSRSGSDKDFADKGEPGIALNLQTPHKERNSFSSFLSSITSKKGENDDASCDTMETPKKQCFTSGSNNSDSLFRGLSPKFVAMFQSRETQKVEVHDEEKQASPEDVLDQIRTFVKLVSSEGGSSKLRQDMNEKFTEHFNDNTDYLEALSDYYASRPELLKYTLEKELHRMNYEVRVRDEDFGCDIMLTSMDEICEFLRTQKHMRLDGKTTEEEMAAVDYLFRVANQSLLADPVELMLQGDSIGPRVMRSVRVHEANFFIDTIDGLVRCDADLRVLLPTDDVSSDDGYESISSLCSASSSTSSQMELSRIKLSVTFSLGTLENGTKSHTAGRLESSVHEIKLNDMHDINSSLFDAQIQIAAKMISECSGTETATQ
jgi:hypothetical protein